MRQIRELFMKSQENISTHQKLIQNLRAIYKSVEFETVVDEITACIDILFHQDYKTNKERHTRTITFVAQFVLDLLTENSDEENENPLVRAIVNRALSHIDIANANCRYHGTQLLETILKNIHTDVNVSAQLCDDIQEHLIDRFLTDTVFPIRLLSGSALAKLQDIHNPRCPVIEGYIRMCCDVSPMIRKLSVMHLALTHSSHETLIRLMRDMDVGVRAQAYKRVGSINPTFLKIIQRQQVIINGIDEENITVRKAFLNTLLPKWLSVYGNNLLSFYNSLRLDAQLNDIEETRLIHDELMKIYFTCFSPTEIIKYLPIGDDCLVPLPQLTSEVSAYWYYLVLNLQKEEKNCGVQVENVLPQLTSFCEYIISVLKSKEENHLEDWQNLQFQEVLYNIFRIVSISDLADEVGRKHLQPLIRETLINVKLEKSVIGQVLEIYKALVSGIEHQCEELCDIMSEIRESIHVNQEEYVELTESQKMELSQLKATIIVLMASVDLAIEEKKFAEAEKLHNEMEQVKKQVDELSAKQVVRQPVRDAKLDLEAMCRCLDILSMFLRGTKLQKLPSSLQVCFSEFVKPAMQIEDVNVQGRTFLVLGQFCILNKDIAEQFTHYLCSPLIATKYGRYDKSSIMACVQAISDVARIHGPAMLGDDDNDSVSVTNIHSMRRRKLYQEVPPEDIVAQCMNVTRGLIMDIMLDLLDEEDDDIRHITIMSLMKLVMNGLLVNSSLLTRLMLKWLNPFIEKHDPKMQQIIGNGLLKYAMNIKSSELVIQRTIVPTLNSIGNAPDNSPFQDVELDHVLLSLCNMTKIQRTDTTRIHKDLALEILHMIKNRPKAKSTYILSKMLLFLNTGKHTDDNFVLNCLDEIDIATQYLSDARVVKMLMKYKNVLNSSYKDNSNGATTEPTLNEGTVDSHQDGSTINKENENPDVIVNGLNSSKSGEITPANSVIDDSQESLQSITSSARKRANKNKQGSTLRVIIERSPAIDKLTAQMHTNSGSSEASQQQEMDSGQSSSNGVENNVESTPMVRRSSRKPQKHFRDVAAESSEEFTPRRSARRKIQKLYSD